MPALERDAVVPSLAEIVGGSVRELRTDRGWTQRDLSDLLNQAGGTWTRASVGLLETEGVRADRLSDLVLLCQVLEVGLGSILRGDTRAQVGGVEMELETVRETLDLSDRVQPAVTRYELDPDRIGAASPSFTQELAERTGLDPDELLARLDAYLGSQDPALVRDALAQVTPDTPRRTAQARRGQATRKLIQLLTTESAEHRSYLVAHMKISTSNDAPSIAGIFIEGAEENQHGVD